MTDQNAFERILASLHVAMLDDTRWPATSALIDEACGLKGNALWVGEGPMGDRRVLACGSYYRGLRRTDLEREYLEVYHPINEAVPRQLQLPEGLLVQIKDLFTPEEKKTSRAYNEGLHRVKYQNGLSALLDGPGGARMTWTLADPAATDGWGASQITMVKGLMPHIRQFVRVRQALVRAQTQNTTLTALLDNSRIGVLHLDRGGRVLAANAPAADILRLGEGLLDRGGALQAWLPAENDRLQKLLGGALPAFRSDPLVGGSMTLRRPSGRVLLVHVSPVGNSEGDFGARRVAALVLAVDPARRPRVDPARLREAFGLTASEGRVTALLAEGRPVLEIARLTGYQAGYVRLLLKRVYKKQGVSGQVALVPRVLAVAALPPR